MALFNRKPDINQAIEAYRNDADAVLIDVRGKNEFDGGHIPGAINIPLSDIQNAEEFQKEKKLYVYCLSGARSSRAVTALKEMGFTDVNNIGGINAYKGTLEK